MGFFQFLIFHTTMVSGRCSNTARNLRYSNRSHSSYSLRCKHLIDPTSHKLAAAKTSWKFSIRPLILQHISRLWNGFDLRVFASDPTVRWKMMEDANLFIAYQTKIFQNMVWIWALRLLQVHPIWHQRRARAARLYPFDGTLASSHCWGSLFRQKTRGSNGFLSFRKGAYIS